MIEEENSCIKEKPSLLKKYDVPIENLSYEFIKKCEDVKILEKILKILRSEEEGHFPDLVQFAENQLRDISPNNRLLMKPEPVPSLSSLNVNDRNKISCEMESWSKEMKKQDSLLKGTTDVISSDIPPIRSYGENFNSQKTTSTCKKSSIKSLDYDAWEKYDADKEIMKMDIEEERKMEECVREKEKKSVESKPNTLTEIGHYSDAEKQVFSVQEKDRGNECFKAGQYEQATQFYTRSISILPNVAAYNNRAIANLKLEKYGEVIMDCNEVLKRDSVNVKALFRRGNAHECKGLYNEAMKDFKRVLEVDPSNKLAISHVSELKKKLEEANEGRPKKARMVVEDMKSFEEEIKSIQILDKKTQPSICSKPSIPSWKSSYSSDPVSSGDNNLNEWGYPRVMCSCTSIPRALQKKCVPHAKETPSKSNIQVANKYSNFQGNKTQLRDEIAEKTSNQVREKNDVIVLPPIDNSSLIVHPLRDMPMLVSDGESASASEASGGAHLLDNRGIESVEDDLENSNEQPMEISKDYDCFSELSIESSKSPYNFLKVWHQITEDEDLTKHASLLKRISPSDLSSVIGDKLDGYMLSTIITCLHLHFQDGDELLFDYLVSISKLPRFEAVKLFLSTQEKNVVRGLFQKLEKSGKHPIPEDLKTSYEL